MFPLGRRWTFNEIGFWDSKEREGVLSLEEVDAKRRAREDYSEWALFEETMWR